MSKNYACSCCKTTHQGIPLAFGAPEPVYLSGLNRRERKKRVQLTDSVCVIDDEHFFLRGIIYIPILDTEDTFDWGVWSSVSRENFWLAMDHWDTEGRENIVPPAFGFLANLISVYDDTIGLHLNVHTRAVGQVPFLEVEPTMHPLAVDQREGITMERAHEIAALLSGNSF